MRYHKRWFIQILLAKHQRLNLASARALTARHGGRKLFLRSPVTVLASDREYSTNHIDYALSLMDD